MKTTNNLGKLPAQVANILNFSVSRNKVQLSLLTIISIKEIKIHKESTYMINKL